MSRVSESTGFAERLDHALISFELHITETQKKTLLNYLEQLSKWNKTYNLTAIRDQEQALIHHVFDSLSVVGPIQKTMQNKNIAAPRIMDVGSGGGLPGVILAITLPQANIICIDTVEKKTAFVRHVAGVLNLKNLDALHARVEEVTDKAMDVVVSRAFASLKDFANLAGQHVVKNGELIAMKGKHPQDEMLELTQTAWIVDKVESLVVPELDAERCLVWMARKG